MRQSKKSAENGNTIRTSQHCRKLVTVMALVFVALTMAVPGVVLAKKGKHARDKERFVLEFNDTRFRGFRDNYATIHLKRALHRQYPRVNVSDYRLRKVVLIAKSHRGRGNVQLRVGPELTERQRVAGYPQDFYYNQRHTYDRVGIRNPFGDSWGPWQLFLRGHFKVKKIVLVVEKRGGRHYNKRHDRPVRWDRHEYRSPDGNVYFRMRW